MDWDTVNNIILRAKLENDYYKMYIMDIGIIVNNHNLNRFFGDNGSMTYLNPPRYWLPINKHSAHRRYKYKRGISNEVLITTANWYDIRYIAHWDYEDSYYNYQDARKIYDRIEESKKMNDFHQIDIEFNYLEC